MIYERIEAVKSGLVPITKIKDSLHIRKKGVTHSKEFYENQLKRLRNKLSIVESTVYKYENTKEKAIEKLEIEIIDLVTKIKFFLNNED